MSSSAVTPSKSWKSATTPGSTKTKTVFKTPVSQPLVGLSVGLYAPDGTLLATTTTNADGEYYFSEDGATESDLGKWR